MRRSNRRNNNETEGAPIGGASWMITFSDLCTLLLSCFVLLLSMSSLSKNALRATFQDFDSTVSSRMHQDHPPVPVTSEEAIRSVLKGLSRTGTVSVRDLDKMSESERKEMSTEEPKFSAAMIWLKRDTSKDRFSLMFGDKVLFESGAANLKADAFPILEAVGNFLRTSEYHAYVDGHTDALAVRNEAFVSNDDLSLARTLAVTQFLLNNCQVNPDRLAVGAYGSTHPLFDNRTAVNRSFNRRVEIIFESTF